MLIKHCSTSINLLTSQRRHCRKRCERWSENAGTTNLVEGLGSVHSFARPSPSLIHLRRLTFKVLLATVPLEVGLYYSIWMIDEPARVNNVHWEGRRGTCAPHILGPDGNIWELMRRRSCGRARRICQLVYAERFDPPGEEMRTQRAWWSAEGRERNSRFASMSRADIQREARINSFRV